MRMFATPEGDAGFALKGNDIVSVFKHPKAPYRNVTKSMLDLAKSQGGQRLDAFDTVLPHLYAQSGFRAVARLPWNEEYKPEGWKHADFANHNGGRPDVVFMAHDPQAGSYQPGDGRTIGDYDEGQRHQEAALAHVATRGNVPAAPGPESYGSGQLIRMAQPLTVHHGTPHEFKTTQANPLGEFNLGKLGSGEGAQAYGQGIYQAGNERVAQGYRDDLAPGVTYKGGSIAYSRTDPHALAVHQVAEFMHDQGLTAHEAIAKVENEYRDSHASAARPWPNEPSSQQEAMRRRAQLHLGVSHAAQRLKPEDFAHGKGHLYESELHIHPEHMLDWDRNVSEQSPYIQERLRDVVNQFPGVRGITGEFVHQWLANPEYRHSNKAHAAKALLDVGIPGIRYLDAGSRSHHEDAQRLRAQIAMMGPGTPQRDIDVAHQRLAQSEARITHNFVVFDPRTINIVKRNGLSAMVDAGADALRDHKQGAP